MVTTDITYITPISLVMKIIHTIGPSSVLTMRSVSPRKRRPEMGRHVRGTPFGDHLNTPRATSTKARRWGNAFYNKEMFMSVKVTQNPGLSTQLQ